MKITFAQRTITEIIIAAFSIILTGQRLQAEATPKAKEFNSAADLNPG